MKKTEKIRMSARALARAVLAAPRWCRMAALVLALGLALAYTADRFPWETQAHALGKRMGDAVSCITFLPPPHDADMLWPKNTCSYRVSVGYCVDIVDATNQDRAVLVHCDNGRMNMCGAAPGKQCHGGMMLSRYDTYSWGACRNGIANDDPENFECK